MECSDFQILVSAMLDGEATPDEQRRVEAHTRSCDTCAAAFARFEAANALILNEAAVVEPGDDLWARLEPQIRSQAKRDHRPAGIFVRVRKFLDSWLLNPAVHVRYAQVGFAAGAAMILLAVLLFRGSGTDTPTAPVPARETMLANADAGILEQRVQSYFQRASFVLLEVKNAQLEEDADVLQIREASKSLLEESVLLKRDLDVAELHLARTVLGQLETVLLDLANLDRRPDHEDVELLRATIRQNDLLIKIEIIDLSRQSADAEAADETLPPDDRPIL